MYKYELVHVCTYEGVEEMELGFSWRRERTRERERGKERERGEDREREREGGRERERERD